MVFYIMRIIEVDVNRSLVLALGHQRGAEQLAHRVMEIVIKPNPTREQCKAFDPLNPQGI